MDSWAFVVRKCRSAAVRKVHSVVKFEDLEHILADLTRKYKGDED